MQPEKLTRLLLVQCLVILLLLTACSDQSTPDNQANQSPQGNNSQNSFGTNAPPTVLLPTPTYSPLPVTPTLAPTPAPPVIFGGKATGGVISDGLTLHPYKSNNATGQGYVSLLFAASLTRRDPQTLLPMPGAAESWKITDTTVTFTLKDGLKWSDGQPLTSADYVWTYGQAKKPENGWPLARQALFSPTDPGSTGIESYEAPDPRTLKIKLHSLTADFVSRADVIEPLPQHTWASLDWNDPTRNPQILAPTVVSGPWKLKEWQRGSSITFERNPIPSLWPSSRLDNLGFEVVPDGQVALQRLRQATLDFYTPSVAEWPSFVSVAGVQAYNWGSARPTWYFAGFNFRKPYLQDKTLRQALAWAVDRGTLLDKGANGLGRPLNSSVSPWLPAFQPFTARYELNLDKARELLKTGGYILKEGKWIGKSGQAIPALKLVYNAPSPLYEGIAATLKANFGALGITVNLQNFDFDDYQKYLASPQADFDLFLSGWTTDYAPENFGEVWQPNLALNSGSYDNGRLLDLYAKATAETDPGRRKEWLDGIQAIEAEDLPYIFLYAQQSRLIANKRLAGFTTDPLGPTKNLYTDWFATR